MQKRQQMLNIDFVDSINTPKVLWPPCRGHSALPLSSRVCTPDWKDIGQFRKAPEHLLERKFRKAPEHLLERKNFKVVFTRIPSVGMFSSQYGNARSAGGWLL